MTTTFIPTYLLGPKIDEETLVKFEFKYSFKFPVDYRQFLLRYNGGAIEGEPVFPMEDHNTGDNGSCLTMMYGIGHTHKEYDIAWNVLSLTDRIAPGLVPIGTDPYGNDVCICLLEDRYGWIYFWDHEFECYPPDFSNCYKIAESFTEFIDMLKPYEFYIPILEAKYGGSFSLDDE